MDGSRFGQLKLSRQMICVLVNVKMFNLMCEKSDFYSHSKLVVEMILALS